MRMNGKKLTVLLGTAVLAMGILTGRGSSAPETTAAGTAAPTAEAGADAGLSAASGDTKDTEAAKTENAPPVDLSGTISMVGFTSMEEFANVFSEPFMEKRPGMTMTAEFVGSGTGVEAVSSGTTDIGNSSRNLKDREKADDVAENIVAIDGIAVVVDVTNTVEDLIKQQLPDTYEGKITNWKDAGGNDVPIVVVGRGSSSGTRDALEELLEPEDVCRYSNELDSTGVVMAKVVSTSDAIGYVSLDVLDGIVEAMKPEGAEPTEENIKAGSYFLSRPSAVATRGEISEQNDLVKALFDHIYSEEGAEIVKSVGLIVVDK